MKFGLDESLQDQLGKLAKEHLWILINMTINDNPQVFRKLVYGEEQILACSAKLIDMVDFKKWYHTSKQNQEIVDDLLWLWGNLIAEENQQDDAIIWTEESMASSESKKRASAVSHGQTGERDRFDVLLTIAGSGNGWLLQNTDCQRESRISIYRDDRKGFMGH